MNMMFDLSTCLFFHALHKTEGPNALCVFWSFPVCNCEVGCGLHTTPEVKLLNAMRLFFCMYLVCLLVSLQIFATQNICFACPGIFESQFWDTCLKRNFEATIVFNNRAQVDINCLHLKLVVKNGHYTAHRAVVRSVSSY